MKVYQKKYEEESELNIQLKETITLLRNQLDKSVTQAGALAGEKEKLSAENIEMKTKLEQIETDLAKKTKYIESSKQRQVTILEEKQEALDTVEALQK